jgi:hypothetical protein
MLLADKKEKGSLSGSPRSDITFFSARHHHIWHCYRDAAKMLSKRLQLFSIHVESNWKMRRQGRVI